MTVVAAAAAPAGAAALRQSTFLASELDVELTATCGDKPPLDSTLAFGRTFSDHMLTIHWTADGGWGAPRIEPVKSFSLHPAAQTLQYGAHAFEGMKAYSGPDGPLLFRPRLNAERFRRSTARLALPSFSEDELIACLQALVRVEASWVPPHSLPGFALYLRPTMMATTPFLGVGCATDAVLFCICSPAGPYVKGGGSAQAVTLALEESIVRAGPGGVGSYKVGGNYAGTIQPALEAYERCGAAQVLYTYAPDGPDGEAERIVCEAGAMNVFFLLSPQPGVPSSQWELVTPVLDGMILPGVTRQSVLDLARDSCGRATLAATVGSYAAAEQPGWLGNLAVSDRKLRVAELVEASAQGRIVECFCTGTAAVVLPVQRIVRADGSEIAAQPFDGARGSSFSGAVADALAAVQSGRVPCHEWSVPC
jgi:branched-chain amino acid aminotransferase